MTRKELQDAVIDVIEDHFLGAYDAHVTLNTNIIRELDADSLDRYEIMSKLEEKLNIVIPPDSMNELIEDIYRVGDICDFLERFIKLDDCCCGKLDRHATYDAVL